MSRRLGAAQAFVSIRQGNGPDGVDLFLILSIFWKNYEYVSWLVIGRVASINMIVVSHIMIVLYH